MRFITTVLALLLCVSTAQADPWEFNLMNDFIRPENKDRYLTNAFGVKVGAWKFANEMYSPRDKGNTAPDTGDRPWDGYTYLEHEGIEPLAFGQEFRLRTRLGIVGEDSGTEALQKYVHDDLGLGDHPTWIGQNPSEATLDVIASKRTREYVQSIVGDTALTQEYGLRLGNVNASFFLDQELKKHFFKNLYLYTAIRGEVVGFNTHLDGRMFHNDTYTVDRQWFVASGRIGFELYFPSWHHAFFNYGYIYLTEEFKGQDGRHSYGTLTFGQKF